MTVHMFRCFIGAGKMSINDLETRVNDWVASNAEWENDDVAHTLTERTTEAGETYHDIDVRFLPTEDKANLQQKFTDKLVNKADWYRVGYHACDHDEENASPCSWDDAAEWTAKDVQIPEGVPTFDVSE